jgi:hypothetical protein
VDSVAEEWYKALPAIVREDWDQLAPAFTARWDTQPLPAKTVMEKTDELIKYKLKPEEVGTMVPHMGRMQHTHVAWAEQILEKAQACQLENRTEYIQQVLGQLPGSVSEGIQQNYTDWTTFTSNIKAIDMAQLKTRANAEKTIRDLTAMVTDLKMDNQAMKQGRSLKPQRRVAQTAAAPAPVRNNPSNVVIPYRPGPYTSTAPRGYQQ